MAASDNAHPTLDPDVSASLILGSIFIPHDLHFTLRIDEAHFSHFKNALDTPLP